MRDRPPLPPGWLFFATIPFAIVFWVALILWLIF